MLKSIDNPQHIVIFLILRSQNIVDFFKENVVMNFTWKMIMNLVIMVLRALLKAEPPKNGELDDEKE